MSVVFTLAVYFVAGLAVIVYLAGQAKLPRGIAVRAGALIFWPAYLPLCLVERKVEPREHSITSLHEQIERLPIPEGRKQEYRRAVDRLGTAFEQRTKELARLEHTEERLRALRTTFQDDNRSLLEAEQERVQRAKSAIERDVGRAKEGILRLVLRLEVIDLGGSQSQLDGELTELEEELTRLFDAQLEVENQRQRLPPPSTTPS